MPTTAGVYIAGLDNGTQVSSTYEGRQLTMVEDELMHPLHADVFVDKGDPVVIARALGATPHTAYGLAVGVALNSASALTDEIAIDTEGIWNLNVNAFDDNGGVDVNPGDALFISDDSAGTNDTSADGVGNCVLSKIRNNVTQIPFGYALGYIGANAVGVIAVKVHWDPRSHWLLDNEMLYFGDGVATPDVTLEWNGTLLEMLPLTDNSHFNIGNGTLSMDVQIFGHSAADYMLWDSAISRLSLINTTLGNDTRIASYHGTMATPGMGDGVGMVEIDMTMTGQATSFCSASSTWVNVTTGTLFVSTWEAVTPRNDGVYVAAGAEMLNGAIFYGGRFQCILPTNDFAVLALFSTNVTQVQTAIFHTNSMPNFGYTAGAHGNVASGSIPFLCDIAGGAIRYIRTYDAAA